MKTSGLELHTLSYNQASDHSLRFKQASTLAFSRGKISANSLVDIHPEISNEHSLSDHTDSSYSDISSFTKQDNKMSMDSDITNKNDSFEIDSQIRSKPKTHFFKSFWSRTKKTQSNTNVCTLKSEPTLIEQPIVVENYDNILQNEIVYLLKNHICLAYFLVSLTLDFCPEILLFYLEVEAFQKLPKNSNEVRKKYALIIYNTFIRRSSPLEINISSSMSQKLAIDIVKDIIPDNIFTKAHAHMFKQLESSVLNFIQKPEHKLMLKSIFDLKNGFTDLEYANYSAAAQISINLHKSYGIRVHDIDGSIDNSNIYMLNESDLTSVDLRSSLESWAHRFSKINLQVPLPNFETAAAFINNNPFANDGKVFGKRPEKFDSNFDKAKSSLSVRTFTNIYSKSVNISKAALKSNSNFDASTFVLDNNLSSSISTNRLPIKNKSETYLLKKSKPSSFASRLWSKTKENS
ncbi:hypothetical protein AYI70_g9607 [Smittium culicis]|uniref:RGS domain-containing protein n=1 Tax=Smittium culicis TaxID=133412 RepID=A0A1R1XAG2_9FUNG|nr:hypothetical protein AYI70_g9607 [Smittium culicis]